MKNKQTSSRDRQWIAWLEEHGVPDDSIRRFLELNPPPKSEQGSGVLTMQTRAAEQEKEK